MTNQPTLKVRVVIVSAHVNPKTKALWTRTQILTPLMGLSKAMSIADAENAKLTEGRAVVVNSAGYELIGVAR